MSNDPSQNSGGLMSNAGLVRYFEQDSGYTIPPKAFVTFAVFIGLVVMVFNIIF